MHFDQRTRRALRAVGLSAAEVREVSDAVVAATEEVAAAMEAFFDGLSVVYSDMDLAHSTAAFPEHDLACVDLHSHAADLRGYVRFDDWGVPVEDGRVLGEDVVAVTLGPPVHDRVRFAADRGQL